MINAMRGFAVGALLVGVTWAVAALVTNDNSQEEMATLDADPVAGTLPPSGVSLLPAAAVPPWELPQFTPTSNLDDGQAEPGTAAAEPDGAASAGTSGTVAAAPGPADATTAAAAAAGTATVQAKPSTTAAIDPGSLCHADDGRTIITCEQAQAEAEAAAAAAAEAAKAEAERLEKQRCSIRSLLRHHSEGLDLSYYQPTGGLGHPNGRSWPEFVRRVTAADCPSPDPWPLDNGHTYGIMLKAQGYNCPPNHWARHIDGHIYRVQWATAWSDGSCRITWWSQQKGSLNPPRAPWGGSWPGRALRLIDFNSALSQIDPDRHPKAWEMMHAVTQQQLQQLVGASFSQVGVYTDPIFDQARKDEQATTTTVAPTTTVPATTTTASDDETGDPAESE